MCRSRSTGIAPMQTHPWATVCQPCLRSLRHIVAFGYGWSLPTGIVLGRLRTGAAAFAIVMVAVAIGALIWNRRLLTLTFVCLLLGIPFIGLGVSALQPAPQAQAGPFVLAAVISAVVAVGASISARRAPQVPFRRPAYLYLLALEAAVVASASVLAIWQPE